jgi:hypothetical protein
MIRSLGEEMLIVTQRLNDVLRQTYTSICRRGDCTLVYAQVRVFNTSQMMVFISLMMTDK